MKYLFRTGNKVSERLSQAPHIFLGLDYDGTITPIKKRPDLAVLSEDMRSLLKDLSQHKRLSLAILSGRSLKDIRQQVRLKNIYYSGNHGFELYLPNRKIISRYSAASLKTIKILLPILKEALKGFSGVLIEDKGITLSVHYRNVPDYQVNPLITIVRLVHQPFARQIRLNYGTKVIEIKPRDNEQTKGKAFRFLKKRSGVSSVLPIYLGDDTTDEDVFRLIKDQGLGIYVGKRKQDSQAGFFLKDIKEVKTFLRRLLNL